MEKKNIIFDGSILNEVQLCAQRTQFGHEMNLRPARGPATPLEEGDLLHHIFEQYYLAIKEQGVDLLYDNEKFAAHVKDCIEFAETYSVEKNLTPDEVSQVIFQFERYTEHYRMDGLTVSAVEEPFIVPLYEDDEITISYTGKIDLIGYDSQLGSIIMDHKKASRTQVPSALSNQFTGYSFATGIRTTVVNKVGFQKTLTPQDRFKRYPIFYTESKIDRWKQNTIWWGKQYAFYIENETWPENRTSCDKYSGCIYEPICDAGTLEAREHLIRTEYVVGEPWDVTAVLKKKKEVKSEP